MSLFNGRGDRRKHEASLKFAMRSGGASLTPAPLLPSRRSASARWPGRGGKEGELATRKGTSLAGNPLSCYRFYPPAGPAGIATG